MKNNADKSFNVMSIPLEDLKENESREDGFLRIMDTFMGEYQVLTYEHETFMPLGAWTRLNFSHYPADGTFPTAWIENEDGFMSEYFIFIDEETMIHRKIEY